MRARISGNARERVEIFGKCIDSSLYDADSARMEAMAHVVVGTAGHIDHGKTSLVKALTGIDADRLKEEKERGITIDIGFASLRLDDETTIGFIDVPGHERFVKNMLAGIGGIDAVMLVIAADEAVMPQTREHLDICALLRVKRGLTVLTKIDTTERDIVDLAEMEVREYLKGSFLQDAPLLRVSSHTGEGIAALTAELRRLALEVAPRDASQIFRLPVDRCFTMKGFGTVVSGTLIAGRIRKDDEVEVLPVQRGARVRGIQVHGRSVDEARAGQRTALNLQRVELDEIERGMVLVPPDVFKPSATFDVEVELLPSAPAPIVRRKRVRFHVGTAEVMGYIVLLGRDVLEPGASAFAQIHLEQATFALPGDRFIVRQYSPMMTIGGGEIIDAQARPPPPRGRHGARRAAGFPGGAARRTRRHARGRSWHPRHRHGGTGGPAGRDTRADRLGADAPGGQRGRPRPAGRAQGGRLRLCLRRRRGCGRRRRGGVSRGGAPGEGHRQGRAEGPGAARRVAAGLPRRPRRPGLVSPAHRRTGDRPRPSAHRHAGRRGGTNPDGARGTLSRARAAGARG